jgi:large subunit ribosomal protein L21
MVEVFMYAIVRTGGKQYQVAQGDQLRVESLAGNVGETVELDDILLVADGEKVQIGKPQVAGAKVTATIVEQGKAKKVLVYKKKRRQGYEVKNGHRQQYTALRIDGISAA